MNVTKTFAAFFFVVTTVLTGCDGGGSSSSGNVVSSPNADGAVGSTADSSVGTTISVVPETMEQYSSLSDSYRIVDITSNDTSTASSLGLFAFDGAGNVTISGEKSERGIGANQAISGTGIYTVESDGLINLTKDIGDGQDTLKGAVTASGDVFMYSKVDDVNEQSIGIGLKVGNNIFSNSSLSGSYRVVDITSNDSSTASSLGLFAFDGAGNVTISGEKSERGIGANQAISGTGTYTVESDGKFTLTDGEGKRFFHGTISESGDMFVYSNISDVGAQAIGIGILLSTIQGATPDFPDQSSTDTKTLRLVWSDSDSSGSPCVADPDAEAKWTIYHDNTIVDTGSGACPYWSGVNNIIVPVSPANYVVMVDWWNSTHRIWDQSSFKVDVTKNPGYVLRLSY